MCSWGFYFSVQPRWKQCLGRREPADHGLPAIDGRLGTERGTGRGEDIRPAHALLGRPVIPLHCAGVVPTDKVQQDLTGVALLLSAAAACSAGAAWRDCGRIDVLLGGIDIPCCPRPGRPQGDDIGAALIQLILFGLFLQIRNRLINIGGFLYRLGF